MKALKGLWSASICIIGLAFVSVAPAMGREAEQESAPDNSAPTIEQLVAQVESAYQQRNWIALEKATAAIEDTIDRNNFWAEMSPTEKNNTYLNLSIWYGDAAREMARYPKAIYEYQQALEILEERDKPTAEYPATLGKIALVYRDTGKLQKALEFFERGQKVGEPIFGSQSIDNATALGNVALTLQSLGQYDRAGQVMEKSIDIYEKTAGLEHPYTGLAYNNYALIAQSSGDYVLAEQQFRKAIDVIEKTVGRNHEYAAAAYSGLAVVINETGRPYEAEPLARQALTSWNVSKGADHPQTFTALSNLAFILVTQNRNDDAIQYLERALAGNRKVFGDGHSLSALFSSNLGGAYARQKKFEAAIPHLRNALNWGKQALGDDHPDIGLYANNLAAALGSLGQFEQAEENLNTALRIIEKGSGKNTTKYVEALANLGLLQLQTDRSESAVSNLRKAVKVARALPGRPGDSALIAQGSLILAIAPGNPGSDEALHLSREALGIIADRRERGARTAPSKSAIENLPLVVGGDDLSGGYDDIGFGFHMKILASRAKILPKEAPKLVGEMFVTAQDSSLSSAAKAMAQSAARTAAGKGALSDLVRRQQDLQKEVRVIDGKVEKALIEGAVDSTANLQQKLDRKAADLAKINDQIDTQFPDYRNLISPKSLTVEEVQDKLTADDGLLLLMPSIGDIFVLAITSDDIAWSRQTRSLEKVENSIERLRCQIDPQGCPEDYFANEEMSDAEIEGYQSYDRAAAYYLYQQLVEPVGKVLKDKDHIYVVSSGALATLPLAALVSVKPVPGDNADPKNLANTMWLGEQYAFTSLPAVSALRGTRGEPSEKRKSALKQDWGFSGFGAPMLAGPDGDGAQQNSVGASGFFRAAGSGELSLADPDSIKKLIPLPGTDRELEAMAKVLDAESSSIVTGAAATETAVRTSEQLSNSQVIIFATHGLLPEELDGLNEPALVFTPPERPTQRDDGVLSASEATELKLDARWVILSACNTATAEGNGGGDSLSSLSRAFLYAGAKSLLASNWRVGDEETAVLTVETIKADRAAPERGRALALKDAMQAVRTGKRVDGTDISEWNPEWVHPASWAPFIHISNAR